MKSRTPLFRYDQLLVVALALLAAPQAQAQLYTGTNSTGFWNTSRWSTATNGPFSSSWTANSASLFKAGTGTYTFTGANNSGAVNVGNITLEDNVAVNFSGGSGTLSGGGVVRTISVGSGSTLDFGTQAFSTATGNGWIKTGNGVLALAGAAFTNGFTLDGGVVVMRGVDAMGAGSGNILTLSNGTVAASSTRVLANTKYGGGIRIYGNITFGALTNVTTLSSATANISFANNVDLGGSTRTLTIGGNGTYTFSGVMSNGGLTVAAAPDATGNLTLSGANTYTGKTTINSGTVVLSGSGTAGATNSDLEVAGGLLNLSAGTKTNAAFTLAGGTITNGSLGASTYALNGGTMGANLNSNAVTVGGNVTLSGTITNGASVNIASGALTYSADNRLGDNVTVTNNGGTINMGGFSDTIGAYNQVAGTITNGTVTAASYNVQAGTVAANLSGSGAFTKSGAGTATLSGNSSYSGTTTVSDGALIVNGDQSTATGTVSVASGAKLGGAGKLGGAVSVLGTLAPGNSIESLAMGALSFSTGSTFAVELDSSVATSVGADLVIASGNLSLESPGTITLTLNDIAATPIAFAEGTTFSLINYSGTWNSGLFTLDAGTLANGATFAFGLNTWTIDYNAVSGGVNFMDDQTPGSFVNIQVVPEPSTYALIALSGVALAGHVIRRRRR